MPSELGAALSEFRGADNENATSATTAIPIVK
jgi:hypothetical protein